MTSYDLTDGQEPISHNEIDCLKKLARMLKPAPIIVNIGAATGVSTCAFLEERPDALIYSVDVLPCEEEFENLRRCGLNVQRVSRILGDSKNAGYDFPYMIDLLFVDGDHWNAGGDIDAWVKTGKVSGIVAFHDYMEECPPNNPGSVYEHVEAGMQGYERICRVERVVAFHV